MAKTALKKTVKPAAPKAAPAANVCSADSAAKDYIVIDHPKNNEVFNKGHYAFRIGASQCEAVEISIDDQPWHPCRHNAGYWWYDWNSHTAGNHQAVARLHSNGSTLVSRRRRFKVS
jgi:hypothetical protein